MAAADNRNPTTARLDGRATTGEKAVNLYQIQDDDRPMYVVATDYEHARQRWELVVRSENPDELLADGPIYPKGVTHLCERYDLLLPDDTGPML